MLLWTHRDWLEKYPSAITKLCSAVDWGNRVQSTTMASLLSTWSKIHPMLALELLGFRHVHDKVRAYAVVCLDEADDTEVGRILVQLVACLKFENFHDSPLTRFLLQRAWKSPNKIGHFLVWYLKSELHDPLVLRCLTCIRFIISFRRPRDMHLCWRRICEAVGATRERTTSHSSPCTRNYSRLHWTYAKLRGTLE